MDNNWSTNDNQGQFSGQPADNSGIYQPYQPVEAPKSDETVKLSEYLIPLLLCTYIPCVGIILMFVFAFSSKEKESKKNFCKAYLILTGISLVVGIIFAIVYGVIFASAMGY